MSKKEESNEYNEMSLDELVEKKKQVKELLANLEDQYRSAAIAENSYKQAKGTNTKKLEQIKKKLEEFGITGDDAPQATPQSAPKSETSATSATASPAPAQVPTSPAPSPASEPRAETFSRGSSSSPATPPAPAASPTSFFSQLKSTIIPDKGGASVFSAPSSSSFEPEIHRVEQKFSVDIEHIKTTLDTMKETKGATDEKLQRMTENIAELRSMIFQRETVLKNYDIKIEKLSETMADIEPQKISKDFNKRDKVAAEAEVRIEKLERKTEDMMKSITETNALIKSIGGLQNVAEIDHEMIKRLAKVQEISNVVERNAERTERMFVEVNKKLEEFTVYKMKQENMEEIVRDLVKSVDRMGIKFENYLERKELDAFRNAEGNVEKQFDILRKALKRAAPFIEAEIPKELLDLQKEKEDVESLISSITMEFQQKKMSEKDFRAVLQKNQEKLSGIDAKLKDALEKFSEEEKAKEEAAAGKSAAAPVQTKPPLQNAADAVAAPKAAGAQAEETAKSDAAAKSAPAASNQKQEPQKQKPAAQPAVQGEAAPAETDAGEEEAQESSGEPESGSEEVSEELVVAPSPVKGRLKPKFKSKPKHEIRNKKKQKQKQKKPESKKSENKKKKVKPARNVPAKARAQKSAAYDPDAGMLKKLLRYNEESDKKQVAGRKESPARTGNAKLQKNVAGRQKISGKVVVDPETIDYVELKAPRAEHHKQKEKVSVKKKQNQKQKQAQKRAQKQKPKQKQKKTAGRKTSQMKKKTLVREKPAQKIIAETKPAEEPLPKAKPSVSAEVKAESRPVSQLSQLSKLGSLGSPASKPESPGPKAVPLAAANPAVLVPQVRAGAAVAPKPAKATEKKSDEPENSALISELNESYKQGLITKEAYEHTKKLLLARK